MSNIYKPGTGGGGIPENVPIVFVTNDGNASASTNILNVIGGVGIETTGSGNDLTIKLANSGQAFTTTVGATTSNVTIINMGAIPSIGVFVSKVVGYDAGGSNNGCAYVLTRAAKTNGTTASLVSDGSPLVFEDTTFASANAEITVSGNSVQVTVTGVAGLTINWTIETTFTAS